MKIAVLGATGPTGMEIVRQALAAAHDVSAVARRPYPMEEDLNLRVIRGDVVNPDFLRTAIAGVDAVLSALGSRDMKHPTTIYSASANAVVTATRVTATRRFICISALPVTPEQQKPALNRYILDPLLYRFFGGGYDDMRRMEEILGASELDWTVFRPPYLLNAPARSRYRTAIDAPLSKAFVLTRSDLAAAMLDAITNRATYRHAVTIAN